LHKASQKIWE